MENKETIGTEILQHFFDELIHRYKTHSKNSGKESSLFGLLSYMVERSIIKESTLKHYTVITLYPTLLYENNSRKIQTVQELEEKTGFCEKTIYNIVGRYQKKFRPKQAIVEQMQGVQNRTPKKESDPFKVYENVHLTED